VISGVSCCGRLFCDELCKLLSETVSRAVSRIKLGPWKEPLVSLWVVPTTAIIFTRPQFKNPLGNCFGDQKIMESSSCKYSGIILRSDLYWVEQVNYIAQKPVSLFTL
jgi:hypothetical protein